MSSNRVKEKYKAIETNRNMINARRGERISFINGLLGIAGLKEFPHLQSVRQLINQLHHSKVAIVRLQELKPKLTINTLTKSNEFKRFLHYEALLKIIKDCDSVSEAITQLEHLSETKTLELKSYLEVDRVPEILEDIDYLGSLLLAFRKND